MRLNRIAGIHNLDHGRFGDSGPAQLYEMCQPLFRIIHTAAYDLCCISELPEIVRLHGFRHTEIPGNHIGQYLHHIALTLPRRAI